jgi:hypothetical protein
MATFMILGQSGEPYDVETDIDEETAKVMIRRLEEKGMLPKYHQKGSETKEPETLKMVLGRTAAIITVEAPNRVSIRRR